MNIAVIGGRKCRPRAGPHQVRKPSAGCWAALSCWPATPWEPSVSAISPEPAELLLSHAKERSEIAPRRTRKSIERHSRFHT
jgi:hypothetical protein